MEGSNYSIDEEERARACGFRNFLSFAAINYYEKKLPLKECGKILDISTTKMNTSLSKRGLHKRKRGLLPGVAPKKKRSIDLCYKIRQNTPFIFPWCALYIYYKKYLLTTYEIAKLLGISQPFVCKLLKKYNINKRKMGVNTHGCSKVRR